MDILQNEAFVGAVITIATILWGVFKSSEVYARHKDSKLAEFIRTVGGIVVDTYRRHVEPAKEKNQAETGTRKLTIEQRRDARDRARRQARMEAEKRGLNLSNTELDYLVEEAVRELKGKAKSAPA